MNTPVAVNNATRTEHQPPVPVQSDSAVYRASIMRGAPLATLIFTTAVGTFCHEPTVATVNGAFSLTKYCLVVSLPVS